MTVTVDNRKAGMALLYGSLGGVVTMAIHPTGASPNLALVSGVAHSLALVSVLLLLLGTCGLARVLNAPDRLAFAALVTFTLACFAVMIAIAVSGFTMPALIRMSAHDLPEATPTWHIVTAAFFQINQAFSRIYSVSTAGAILLWSITCLRTGRLSRGVALYGAISAPLVAVLIAVGHLRLNVHGMTAVMLSQVIWFSGMGLRLRRAPGLVA